MSVGSAAAAAVAVPAAGTVALTGIQLVWQLEPGNQKQLSCSCCTWGSSAARLRRRERRLDR